MEFLLLAIGLVAGYLLGRWRRDVWARERMIELERAWSQKLRRGDEAFLARLRTTETELEILRARARKAGLEVAPPPEPKIVRNRVEYDERDEPTGSTTLRPIHQVMKDRPDSDRPPDDLTQLRGIGPKTAEHLVARGIRSYAHLAGMEPTEIKDLLADGGFGVASADPESWPAQATLASEGRWLALKALQAAKSRGHS